MFAETNPGTFFMVFYIASKRWLLSALISRLDDKDVNQRYDFVAFRDCSHRPLYDF
jgi:hypothetical protein